MADPHSQSPHSDRRTVEAGGERGSAAVEYVICAGLMMLMFTGIVQFAVYFHLRSVATTAARHGVDQVRILDGTTTAGITTANEFLAQNGKTLENSAVTADRTATMATVTVTGRVITIVPLLSLHLTVSAQAPTERLDP